MDKYKEIIPNYKEFKQLITEEKPFEIRINTIKTNIDVFLNKLEKKGINYKKRDMDDKFLILEKKLSRSLEHWLGHFYVQEFTSAIPVKALDVNKKDNVLDMCAAPGSKTTQMAGEMNNRGQIIANEPVTNRLRSLMGNLYKLGVLNTRVIQYDGQVLPEDQMFDKILIDAPCSGEATIREEEKNQLNEPKNRKSLIEIQHQLIEKGIDLLKPGGELVYSTCTFSPKENEEVINNQFGKEIELINLNPSFAHSDAITRWRDKKYNKEMNKAIRVYPHQVNSGGIFVAKIKKRS